MTLAPRPRCGSSTSPARPSSATGWSATPARRSGVHREGRRQHDRDRLDRRLPGGCSSNIAFTLSLYSGQMCTSPQNILVPRDGIETDKGHRTFDQVAEDLGGRSTACSATMPAPPRSSARSSTRYPRAARARPAAGPRRARLTRCGQPRVPGRDRAHPADRARRPAPTSSLPHRAVRPDHVPDRNRRHRRELELLARSARDTARSPPVSTRPARRSWTRPRGPRSRPGALSSNLTGAVYVNQSAAFSDFHATGGNPAANATLTDGAFVASRFRIVQSRRHAAPEDGGRRRDVRPARGASEA